MTDRLRVMLGMIRELHTTRHVLTNEQQIQGVIRSLLELWTHMKQILTHNESIKTFVDISPHVELETER